MSTSSVTEAEHQVDTISLFSTIEELPSDQWNSILGYNNVYLSIPYLNALESALPDMRFCYVVFYSNKQPVGIAYFQMIRITSQEINGKALKEKMGGMLPSHFIDSLDLGILICGNAFATGENGFKFLDSVQGIHESVCTAVDMIVKKCKLEKQKISVCLIKEFWPESFSTMQEFKGSGYAEISIDVNMIVHLLPEWKTFDDYLGGMNSKFRTKAKHVLKQSKDITVIDFEVQSLQDYMGEIDHLYNQLVDNANFSFGRLNAQALCNMKQVLGPHFLFKGYFINEKLIGFSTATSFDNVLDGNYIGLDYAYNQDYAVYQRMLYDFIEHGINEGLTEIRIGRTAEEIKSGVGAMPTEMKFYAKHRNKLTNAILKPFVQNLKPSEFKLRKPFKAEYYN